MASDEGAAKAYLQPDLLIVMLLALAGAFSSLALPDGNPARILLAIPLLLFLPGYALAAALWPQSDAAGKGIDNLGRAAVSIGLSIVVMSVIGLGASLAGALTLLPVLGGNLAALFAFTAIAIYRRAQLPRAERYAPLPGLFSRPAGAAKTALMAALVCGIVVCSGAAAYMVFRPAEPGPYSEFYCLGANATAADYPVNITVNETAIVTIGIACHEMAQTDYVILASAGNASGAPLADSWDGTVTVANGTLLSRNVTIADGGSFEDDFSFCFTTPGIYKLTWRLQIDGQATDYELHLWVRVNP